MAHCPINGKLFLNEKYSFLTIRFCTIYWCIGGFHHFFKKLKLEVVFQNHTILFSNNPLKIIIPQIICSLTFQCDRILFAVLRKMFLPTTDNYH